MLLAITTIGMAETPMPNSGEFESKTPESINPAELYLGEIALAPVVNLADHLPTPRDALRSLPEAA